MPTGKSSLNGLMPYFSPLEAVAGVKAATNAVGFGTPMPVTLSQPAVVFSACAKLQEEASNGPGSGCGVQSVPKEITIAVSSMPNGSAQIPLTKPAGAASPK